MVLSRELQGNGQIFCLEIKKVGANVGRPREPWKREKLLEAAMSAVATRGLSGLTVKDVAKRAGVSPGSIHYHFSDIDGLVLGVVERALEQMYTLRLSAIEQSPDVREKLKTLIDLGVPDSLTHEVAFLYESIGVVRANPSYAAILRSYVDRQVSLYRSVIDAGVTIGVFRTIYPSERIARNFLALEDAYDLYRAVGIATDGETGRAALREYAHLALGVEI